MFEARLSVVLNKLISFSHKKDYSSLTWEISDYFVCLKIGIFVSSQIFWIAHFSHQNTICLLTVKFPVPVWWRSSITVSGTIQLRDTLQTTLICIRNNRRIPLGNPNIPQFTNAIESCNSTIFNVILTKVASGNNQSTIYNISHQSFHDWFVEIAVD